MASYPDGPPEDPTGKFYLHTDDLDKAVKNRIKYENLKESSDVAIASFEKSHTAAAALKKKNSVR